MAELDTWLKEEIGYQWIQGTRPQTLAFGLSDSPVGLAAWIAEKFRAWTDCGGDPRNALTMDEMLGDVSLYWFTNCIGASFWPYYARMHGRGPSTAASTCRWATASFRARSCGRRARPRNACSRTSADGP
jgi:microsomal epoxide hydrolase